MRPISHKVQKALSASMAGQSVQIEPEISLTILSAGSLMRYDQDTKNLADKARGGLQQIHVELGI